MLGTIEAVAVGGEVGGGGLGGSCIRHSGAGDALINESLFQHLGADGGREAAAGKTCSAAGEDSCARGEMGEVG